MSTSEPGVTGHGDPITGATRIVGIVGDPIAQVKSPIPFNRLLAQRGIDAVLVPLQVRSDRFETDLGAVLSLGNLDGLVVTMPFKSRIIPALSAISSTARSVGAVNAVRRTEAGGWFGDIFDGVGLVGAARAAGCDPRGVKAGLVGAGGAGSAIAFALADAGVAFLDIADRNGRKAEDLAARLSQAGFSARAVPVLDPHGLDLVVNASPVGMGDGDASPFDTARLVPSTTVVDIVTRHTTRLLDEARHLGCPCAGGAAMVAAQMCAIVDFLGLPARSAAPSSRTREERP